MNPKHSLAHRTLYLAVFRIAIVAIGACVVSYLLNRFSIEEAQRAQLLLSTEQTLQRESLPFREIRELQRNFHAEFRLIDSDPERRQALIRDFDLIFYRHDDGSYTQRPGIFEGQPLFDGRRFANMSATYAPDHPPTADIKARLALSFLLSHKYGSTTQGRLFNFYGVLPEKGFPIYQATDIAKVFTYNGPEALIFENYEFYSRGFTSTKQETFSTRMYFDYSNNAWMTTVATPDVASDSGKHRILACVDILLDQLMERLANPSIKGAYSVLFLDDDEGSLMFHPNQMEVIKKTEGRASIKSLNLDSMFPLLHLSVMLEPGKVTLIDTKSEIVAVGRIPETSIILSIHYPRSLMQPAILQNLAVVVALGLITLLVETFLIRSVLQNQVALPLQKLMRATQAVVAMKRLENQDLPTQSEDEIGELSRDFISMSEQIYDSHERLEAMVSKRTIALEVANKKLAALSITDELTKIANRRHFDYSLKEEWRRAKRSGNYLVLAMLDVDWFKKYNDCYGHNSGDECLKNVASTLQEHFNRAGDLVARYGGEEFALIFTTTHSGNALLLAESICKSIEKKQIRHEMSPFGVVTVSIGVAGVVPVDEEPSSLLKLADTALYRAKELGRNQAVIA